MPRRFAARSHRPAWPWGSSTSASVLLPRPLTSASSTGVSPTSFRRPPQDRSRGLGRRTAPGAQLRLYRPQPRRPVGRGRSRKQPRNPPLARSHNQTMTAEPRPPRLRPPVHGTTERTPRTLANTLPAGSALASEAPVAVLICAPSRSVRADVHHCWVRRWRVRLNRVSSSPRASTSPTRSTSASSSDGGADDTSSEE